MNQKKHLMIQFLLALLFTTIILSGCGDSYMPPEKALNDFSSRIEQGNLSNLTLTIYYSELLSTFHFPDNAGDFVGRGMYDRKVVITGSELKEHVELLRQLNVDSLVSITHEYPKLVMLYYVFEVNGRKIFDFVPLADGDDSTMLINGVTFKWVDTFFDVIRPFLPDDVVIRWDASIHECQDDECPCDVYSLQITGGWFY